MTTFYLSYTVYMKFTKSICINVKFKICEDLGAVGIAERFGDVHKFCHSLRAC